MVPINPRETNLDLIAHLKANVILVSQNYLGSINHTLLSIESLRRRDLPIKGVIFNGDENVDTESIIVKMGKVKHLGRIPKFDKINLQAIINSGKLIHV